MPIYLSRHSHLLYFHRSQVEMPSLIARHISMWKAPFPFLPNLNHTWSLLMHNTEFFSASPFVYSSLPFLSNITSMIPQQSIRSNEPHRNKILLPDFISRCCTSDQIHSFLNANVKGQNYSISLKKKRVVTGASRSCL